MLPSSVAISVATVLDMFALVPTEGPTGLRAEHEKFPQDYEAEKAQQQFYRDEQIRSDQRWLDWALEPIGR